MGMICIHEESDRYHFQSCVIADKTLNLNIRTDKGRRFTHTTPRAVPLAIKVAANRLVAEIEHSYKATIAAYMAIARLHSRPSEAKKIGKGPRSSTASQREERRRGNRIENSALGIRSVKRLKSLGKIGSGRIVTQLSLFPSGVIKLKGKMVVREERAGWRGRGGWW